MATNARDGAGQVKKKKRAPANGIRMDEEEVHPWEEENSAGASSKTTGGKALVGPARPDVS